MRSGQATRCSTGAACGRSRTMSVIAIRLSTMASSAGTIAARNRSKMKVLATMQYRIITIEGGMSDFSVPPAAIVPVENAAE